jgi:tetratricopeptide (TPR) repeat protein
MMAVLQLLDSHQRSWNGVRVAREVRRMAQVRDQKPVLLQRLQNVLQRTFSSLAGEEGGAAGQAGKAAPEISKPPGGLRWLPEAGATILFVVGPDVVRGKIAVGEPGFVGRDSALQLLRVARQDQHLVTVQAPAGGGKTRLLREWTRALPDRVLWSKADRETAPSPFQMFAAPVTALESELAARPDLATVLVHELGVELPLLRSLGGSQGSGLQRGVVVMLALLLIVFGRDRPTILVLDDCQWADPLTLRFLEYWGEHGHSLMVVATFREEEIEPEHPLRRLKALRVPLPPLDEQEARKLLLAREPEAGQDAVSRALREAQGNPFSLLAWSHGGVAAWQTGVARFQALPEPLREALGLASVLGRQFTLAALEECLERPVDLSQAQAEGFLEAAEDGLYRFTHDRVRDRVFRTLAAEEARLFHLRVARHLAGQPEGSPFEAAFHFHSAGKPEEGFGLAVRAAELALSEHDSATAEFYLRAALEGCPAQQAEQQERLWTQLGDCYRMTGCYTDALDCFSKALALCQVLSRRARLLERLGDVHFKKGELVLARASIERGLAALGESSARSVPLSFLKGALGQLLSSALPRRKPGTGKHSERDLLCVDLYNRLAYVLWFLEGPLPSIAAHLRELSLAERHPPSRSLARARSTHAIAMSAIPHWSRSLAFGRTSVQTARDLQDRWAEGQACHFYGAALYGASRLAQAREVLESSVRILRQTGDRWEENGARYHLALVYYRQGELELAAHLAEETHRIGLEIGDRLAAGDNLFTWARASGGLIPEQSLLDEQAHDNPDIQRASELMGAQGLLEIRAGRYDAAGRLFQQAIALYRSRRARTMYSACLPCWRVTACRLSAQSLEGKARTERLREASGLLRSALAMAARYRNELAHALREQALLAMLQGQGELAARTLRRSAETAAELGMTEELKIDRALGRLWGIEGPDAEGPNASDGRGRWNWLLDPSQAPRL